MGEDDRAKGRAADRVDAAWLAQEGDRGPHPDPERGDEYKRLEDHLRRLPAPQPRPDWERLVWAALDQQRRDRRLFLAALALAVVLAAVVGWLWGAHDRPAPAPSRSLAP